MADPVSKTRLQQIALKRLLALGIAARAEGERVVGELATGAYGLKNPSTGERIEEVRFEVDGHDRLRLLAPPLLTRLATQPFFEHENLGGLVNQIASVMERRLSSAQQAAMRLRTLGLPTEIDGSRLVAVARVELTPQGVALLEGSDEGIRATELLPPTGSKRAPLPLGGALIDLREFADRVDLEIFLGSLADQAVPVEAEPALASGNQVDDSIFAPLGDFHSGGSSADGFATWGAPPSGVTEAPVPSWTASGDSGTVNWAADVAAPAWEAPARPVAPAPPPRPTGPPVTVASTGSRPLAPTAGTVAFSATGPLTLDIIVRLFGAEAALSQGFSLGRDVEAAGQKVRFTVRHDEGRTFTGRISGPSGVLWEDRFELDGFPGAPAFVAQRLAAPRQAPRKLEPQPSAPAVGQVWSMAVNVEAEDAEGVRYVMVAADGKPTAAARVLRRAEFEATFAGGPEGPRLLARVVEVSGGSVAYEQLDPRGQPVGTPRRSPERTFISSFRPERRP